MTTRSDFNDVIDNTVVVLNHCKMVVTMVSDYADMLDACCVYNDLLGQYTQLLIMKDQGMVRDDPEEEEEDDVGDSLPGEPATDLEDEDEDDGGHGGDRLLRGHIKRSH